MNQAISHLCRCISHRNHSRSQHHSRSCFLALCLSSHRSSFSSTAVLSSSTTITTSKDLAGDPLYTIGGTAMLYKSFYGLGKQKYYAQLTTQPAPGTGSDPPPNKGCCHVGRWQPWQLHSRGSVVMSGLRMSQLCLMLAG